MVTIQCQVMLRTDKHRLHNVPFSRLKRWGETKFSLGVWDGGLRVWILPYRVQYQVPQIPERHRADVSNKVVIDCHPPYYCQTFRAWRLTERQTNLRFQETGFRLLSYIINHSWSDPEFKCDLLANTEGAWCLALTSSAFVIDERHAGIMKTLNHISCVIIESRKYIFPRRVGPESVVI